MVVGEDAKFNKPKFCASDGGNTALAALYVIIGAFDWFCTLLHKTLLIGTFFSNKKNQFDFLVHLKETCIFKTAAQSINPISIWYGKN